MTDVAQEAVSSISEEAASVVIETAHGPLKLPIGLYGIWQTKGWPEDDVLADMAADGRWRP